MNQKEKDSRNNNGKRWGNKFIDKRNWKSYNEELVMRGEFLLPIDMFDNWDEELDKVNEGKKGRPYEFPESFIKIQAVWHQQWVDYRGLEGIASSLERLWAYSNDAAQHTPHADEVNTRLLRDSASNATFGLSWTFTMLNLCGSFGSVQ